MEPINKAELEQLKFKAKKSLRNGDITLYDALELMAKTIDDTVDYMNETSATLVKNENERIENENTRIEAMVDADGLAAALYYTVKKIERDDEDFENHPALWRFYNKSGAEVEGRKLELPVCGSTPEGEVVGLLTVADYNEFKAEHVATINILQENGKLWMKTYNYGDTFIDDEEFPTATASSDGVMSAADKTKLDALPTGASLASSLTAKADKTAAIGSVSATGMEDTVDLELTSVSGAYLASVSIPAASSLDAGVMLPDEKAKLAALPTNASLAAALGGKATVASVNTLNAKEAYKDLFIDGIAVSTRNTSDDGEVLDLQDVPIIGNRNNGAVTRTLHFSEKYQKPISVTYVKESLFIEAIHNWDRVKEYELGTTAVVNMTGSTGCYKGSLSLSGCESDTKYVMLIEVEDDESLGSNNLLANTFMVIENTFS